ncbi:hypothetical protein EV44_g3092 [Erysiphe necator]|uniref:Uncharacterized protein n=1 Tax=Uncinula necator TaxID=52586 RepID=A0A0B1P417_UNCNE|nr:hypothetical protein EV44_g3092 [Erysiphe necator]
MFIDFKWFWARAWHIALRGAKYWKAVTDGPEKEMRHVHRKNESFDEYLVRLELYDDKNDAAHSALLSSVDQDLQKLVCSCDEEPESARVAMRLLKIKNDYETSTSTIESFKKFSESKTADGGII